MNSHLTELEADLYDSHGQQQNPAYPHSGNPIFNEVTEKNWTAQERRDALAAGHAIKIGDHIAFPIDTKADLEDAIGLIGNTSDPDKAKAFIKRRAKDLGAEDMIPDTW